MATDEQPVRIISNESNFETQIESGPDEPPARAQQVNRRKWLQKNSWGGKRPCAIERERSPGRIHHYDGAVVETMTRLL
jgi:hypothetical protein